METVTTPLPHFRSASCQFLPLSFSGQQIFSVMLAQKVLHFAVLAAAFDGRQMVKPFIPFSINRLLFSGSKDWNSQPTAAALII